jgi:tryptophanyl-tRNA synthetase
MKKESNLPGKSLKKLVFTGTQATGKLHLGNYFGSIKNIARYSEQKVIIFLADLHSLTTQVSISEQNSLEILSYYYEACPGALFFIQSECAEIILRIYWFLCCHVTIGKLEQMTQYKDKRGKAGNFLGLLVYPILQAADIFSCGAELVPVGQDQRQHLEFSRDLARKINSKYKKQLFTVPRTVITSGCKIMDLRHPEKKMSKSNPSGGTIYLGDSQEDVKKKIAKARTDSGKMPSEFQEERRGINNLIEIYTLIKEISPEEVYEDFAGKNISEFKAILTEELINFLEKIQPRISNQQMRIILDEQKPVIQSLMEKNFQPTQKTIFMPSFCHHTL